jgi:hypothetical protein
MHNSCWGWRFRDDAGGACLCRAIKLMSGSGMGIFSSNNKGYTCRNPVVGIPRYVYSSVKPATLSVLGYGMVAVFAVLFLQEQKTEVPESRIWDLAIPFISTRPYMSPTRRFASACSATDAVCCLPAQTPRGFCVDLVDIGPQVEREMDMPSREQQNSTLHRKVC